MDPAMMQMAMDMEMEMDSYGDDYEYDVEDYGDEMDNMVASGETENGGVVYVQPGYNSGGITDSGGPNVVYASQAVVDG